MDLRPGNLSRICQRNAGHLSHWERAGVTERSWQSPRLVTVIETLNQWLNESMNQ